MHRLSEKMSDWLGKRLPKLTDNWWADLVYNNLSQCQRDNVDARNITDLKGLDLAALLRVFDRNWFVITSSWFVNYKERQKIKKICFSRYCDVGNSVKGSRGQPKTGALKQAIKNSLF